MHNIVQLEDKKLLNLLLVWL